MKKDNIIEIDRISSSYTNNKEHVFSEQFIKRKQEMINKVKQEDLERRSTGIKHSKVAAAVILLLCTISIGVPVAAKAIAYLNGNTKNNFKEEVSMTLDDISDQMPDASNETVTEDKSNAGTIDGIDIEILDMSRVDNEITFKVQMTFDEDITQWISPYYDYQLTYGTLMTSDLLKNSSVHLDGVNLDSDYLDFDVPNPISTVCTIISHEKHTLNLRIALTDTSDEQNTFEGEHTIDLFFSNIKAGDEVYEGFWAYTHEFDSNKYDNTELVTQPIELNAKTSATYDPKTLSITSYALTQNGICFYGTCKSILFHSDEWYEDETNNQYPQTFASARLHAEDDLGNHYIFYQRTMNTINDSTTIQDTEIEYQVVYELYDDTAIIAEDGASYRTELDPHATYLTVYVEEEVAEAEHPLDDSPLYYRPISDSVTIPLANSLDNK